MTSHHKRAAPMELRPHLYPDTISIPLLPKLPAHLLDETKDILLLTELCFRRALPEKIVTIALIRRPRPSGRSRDASCALLTLDERRRRALFIVCDSPLRMKLHQERHRHEHVAPNGACLLIETMFYKRDTPTALKQNSVSIEPDCCQVAVRGTHTVEL